MMDNIVKVNQQNKVFCDMSDSFIYRLKYKKNNSIKNRLQVGELRDLFLQTLTDHTDQLKATFNTNCPHRCSFELREGKGSPAVAKDFKSLVDDWILGLEIKSTCQCGNSHHYVDVFFEDTQELVNIRNLFTNLCCTLCDVNLLKAAVQQFKELGPFNLKDYYPDLLNVIAIDENNNKSNKLDVVIEWLLKQGYKTSELAEFTSDPNTEIILNLVNPQNKSIMAKLIENMPTGEREKFPNIKLLAKYCGNNNKYCCKCGASSLANVQCPYNQHVHHWTSY